MQRANPRVMLLCKAVAYWLAGVLPTAARKTGTGQLFAKKKYRSSIFFADGMHTAGIGSWEPSKEAKMTAPDFLLIRGEPLRLKTPQSRLPRAGFG